MAGGDGGQRLLRTRPRSKTWPRVEKPQCNPSFDRFLPDPTQNTPTQPNDKLTVGRVDELAANLQTTRTHHQRRQATPRHPPNRATRRPPSRRKPTPPATSRISAPTSARGRGWVRGREVCEIAASAPSPSPEPQPPRATSQHLRLSLPTDRRTENVPYLGRDVNADQKIALLWSQTTAHNIDCGNTGYRTTTASPTPRFARPNGPTLDPFCAH